MCGVWSGLVRTSVRLSVDCSLFTEDNGCEEIMNRYLEAVIEI